jgi:hypothetical protein
MDAAAVRRRDVPIMPPYVALPQIGLALCDRRRIGYNVPGTS